MEKNVVRKIDAGTLLMANLRKVAEASREMNPLDAAYLAGRLEGLTDAVMLKRVTEANNKTA